MKIELEEFEYGVGLRLRVTPDDDTEYALLRTGLQDSVFEEDGMNVFFIMTLPVSNGD